MQQLMTAERTCSERQGDDLRRVDQEALMQDLWEVVIEHLRKLGEVLVVPRADPRHRHLQQHTQSLRNAQPQWEVSCGGDWLCTHMLQVDDVCVVEDLVAVLS